VFVPDLGADRIMQYNFDPSSDHPLRENPLAAFVSVKAGAGPRHLAFSSTFNSVAYGANELDSTLNVYLYDSDSGVLTLRQTFHTVSADFLSGTNPNYPAEVVVSFAGDYVYVSNRGNDTIAKFAVDMSSGLVSGLVSLTPVAGSYPRFIGFDRTGHFMFAANQNSDNVAIFEVDSKDGGLKLLSSVAVPTPQHAYFV
jgi:6-phosphogluconolactonase